jgi:hypothetical protein
VRARRDQRGSGLVLVALEERLLLGQLGDVFVVGDAVIAQDVAQVLELGDDSADQLVGHRVIRSGCCGTPGSWVRGLNAQSVRLSRQLNLVVDLG